ncbi:ATP-binding protein [Edaphobacter modestus]|uniref:histidine kinase n=1 Tax=Edaphobacter modestus TaxID=388466 RepID=A0A4Q7YZP8_9BACT|nr:ATP-binding protein [Edaphobacter modestus]RZU43004.1 cyclic nucleotide-binding protein [Edaphobacter modestus]
MSQQTPVVQQPAAAPISDALFAKLRTTSIFSSLKEEELRCLKGLEEIQLKKGDLLVRQGEVAHNFWVLLEGSVLLSQTMPDGREMEVTSIPSGNAFGELPLLANIPNAINMRAEDSCHLVQLNEEGFWSLMTTCPDVRKAILGNMAKRFQRMQSATIQQEKMASLGTLAAGLMHELNNPGTAARRAASQLRANLMRMHELSAKFSKIDLSREQKECLHDLQEHTLQARQPIVMNSLEQSDAEEALAEWMEGANIENAWKMAPTLVSIGLKAEDLECARSEFPGSTLSDALNWLEAMASSMQLVATIEESIGRVSDLVMAVKSYAYEGKGLKQSVDINSSIHATLVILSHKMREKEITVEKDFAADLPPLQSECTGLNQIWTNLLDNSIDAVGPHGKISVKTWAEKSPTNDQRTDICIRIADDGSGIPLDSQAHIFDTFYTTKPVGVGTGLGLGIVHRIVDQYGGIIRFSSVPGSTEFIVRLPAQAPQSA